MQHDESLTAPRGPWHFGSKAQATHFAFPQRSPRSLPSSHKAHRAEAHPQADPSLLTFSRTSMISSNRSQSSRGWRAPAFNCATCECDDVESSDASVSPLTAFEFRIEISKAIPPQQMQRRASGSIAARLVQERLIFRIHLVLDQAKEVGRLVANQRHGPPDAKKCGAIRPSM